MNKAVFVSAFRHSLIYFDLLCVSHRISTAKPRVSILKFSSQGALHFCPSLGK